MSTSMSLGRAIAFAAIAATSTFAFPQSSIDPRAYQQCGGIGYAGATTCPPGFPCTRLNDYFSMCYPPATTATTSSATTTPIVITASSIKITTTTNTANTRSYQQCGGIGYAGPTECPSDLPCTRFNDYFSTCGPPATTSSTWSTTTMSTTTTTTTTPPTITTSSTTTILPPRAYAQCGGQGYTGPTTCPPGYPCQRENDYFSNCLPATTTSTTTSITTTPTTTSSSLSTTKSCASTVCQDFINSCGQTYGGCYLYCSGFTRPTFTPPPCTTTSKSPPTTTKPPSTTLPPISTSTGTKCTQTLCEDFINSCGRMYGGCYPFCIGDPTATRRSFTDPGCPTTTPTTSPTITSKPPSTTLPPTLISTSTKCTLTLCEDLINSCGRAYGGCYEVCGAYTRPSFTVPTCPPTTTPSTTSSSISVATAKPATCTSTRCDDNVNACGKTYGGCYPYCSGFSRPTFVDPGCSSTKTSSKGAVPTSVLPY
ncbi:hypothetical protein B0A48_06702 [Cryoendolithus antarcticus]|uniref:CBM1 domain-containing protein n=1 Tax=Cryoendolithus antarcticus TaxID=1507870 RepID=A0A1V8T984_9PEZI|nr:hypothetical protein B0A48_06702 [Cryoendolithus antarcticus]